jgi:SAM-dependent methyltransferase
MDAASPDSRFASACILCGGRPSGAAFPYETRWRGTLFRYLRCGECGSTFVAPLPESSLLEEMFDASTYFRAFYPSNEASAEQRQTVDDLTRLLPHGAAILDFGCGNGAFLKAAAAAGFRCTGVEQSAVVGLARTNTQLPIMTLQEAEEQGLRFDLIHISDVLGHLPEPAAVLRRLEPLLLDGGVFVVEGPLERQRSLVYYAASATARLKEIAGRRATGRHAPYHLSLTDLPAQLYFFTEVLGYSCASVDLWETGWPYLGGSAVQGAASRLRRRIGRLAVFASGTRLGKRLRLGNRFRAVLRPGPAVAAAEASLRPYGAAQPATSASHSSRLV